MKVPDVRRNLVPDTWTADGEGARSPQQNLQQIEISGGWA